MAGYNIYEKDLKTIEYLLMGGFGLSPFISPDLVLTGHPASPDLAQLVEHTTVVVYKISCCRWFDSANPDLSASGVMVT